ncbi:trypsin-like peptidase domain-containing protein [Streptomyces similanensis]|uniref:Serine protease n=1 Tax=Streptomyces similanensis TaxID=1274988 RepID=A0ABP9L626_9ACTN
MTDAPGPGAGRASGPELERVAALTGGGRTGSGYLLTPRLVLTAAHVAEGLEHVSVSTVGGGTRLCRVVWRRHDAAVDAALLLAPGDLVPPDVAHRLGPVHWARLTDASPIGDCQAMGFPRIARAPGGRLDIEHIECALRPGAGLVRGRYVLDVKDVAPEAAGAGSPWGGMSGAALFARGQLLGVIVSMPENFSSRRLEAVRSSALLADASLTAAVAAHGGAPPLVTELSAAAPERKPLVLAGVRHTARRDLAATIRSHWAEAARQFFGGGGRAEERSEGSRHLLAWLRQFDDAETDDVEGLRLLIDRWLLRPGLTADLKLLRLLSWLDPSGDPVWRGAAVTFPSLTRACLEGRLADGGPDRDLYDDLCRGELLDALAGFTALSGVEGLQRDWDRARAASLDLVRRAPGVPADVREWTGDGARGLLLAALLPHPEAGERLRLAGERVTPPADGVLAWYDWLRSHGADAGAPVAWLVRTDLAAYAARHAELAARQAAEEWTARRTTEALREAHALRARQWRAYEEERRAPGARLAAARRAVVWVGLWGAAATGTVWLVWGHAEPGIARTVSWQCGWLTAAGVLGRVLAALRLGAAYRPPLFGVRRGTRAADARSRPFARLAGDAGRWLLRAGVAVAAIALQGALVHDSTVVSLAVFGLALCLVLMASVGGARSGAVFRDWDEEHRGRLEEYRERQAGVPRDVLAKGRSGAPGDRAEAYAAVLQQFTDLGRGGPGGGRPDRRG